jgi:hypothetical protein
MRNGMQDYGKGCNTYMWVNQQAWNALSLLKTHPGIQGDWACVGEDYITDVSISLG